MPDKTTTKTDKSASKHEKISIAYFITPHGFGHAARAAAIMAEIHDLNQAVFFEIYTLIPDWFFQDSLGPYFRVHPVRTDIGLIQKSPLQEDLPATLQSLADFIPFNLKLLEELANEITNLSCRIVLCDIAPLGIAIAHKASLPSVLIENFTWDWIYQAYLHEYAKFAPIIDYLKEIFNSAAFHIQTEPICEPDFKANLTTHPVSRRNRLNLEEVQEKLAIPPGVKTIMITMGGIQTDYNFLARLRRIKDTYFVIPGIGSNSRIEDNLILLPHHSNYFHPDLVNACDAVIGKTGYSTVSEVYHAGVPYGFVSRPKFRESEKMAVFIGEKISGFEISEQDFSKGDWVSRLPELFSFKRVRRKELNGAIQVANFILPLLDRHR
ncbi:MAG: glycosyltransferase family protein [Anaerolineaceae bacterium]|nr:glycosyltransferase family protein [Anaerolineaceae bacterium]